MPTTWIKALHVGKGKTMLSALGERTGYVMNPDKTEGGELVSAYGCDPRTAQEEFLLSKRQYAYTTGRDQGKRDVIAYHIRQSFKPGEIDAQTANAIGYKLALAFTKGRHQFIVATHTNTDSIHSHIIFNSTDLECGYKFVNFKHSAIALRKVSDRICLEHGLSIIEKPGLSKGRNYGEWLGGKKKPSVRDGLRSLIEAALEQKPADFDAFITILQDAGCEVKQGKHLSIRPPGGERFLRCKSLGDDYTEDAIQERISGKRVVTQRETADTIILSDRPNLLIDIEAKIRQGKGVGYEKWAARFNLKEMSKTLIFLQENGLTDYDDLERLATGAADAFNGLSAQIKAAETRMAEISELQKQIGTYSKTLDMYRQYKASGYSKDFYDTHTTDILLHQAAKQHFDALGLAKLPTINMLKQEYGKLLTEKRKLYPSYRAERDKMRALVVAKNNVDRLLDISPAREKDHRSGQEARQ